MKMVQNRTKSTKIQYLQQLQRTVIIKLLTKIQLSTLLNNHVMSLPDLEKAVSGLQVNKTTDFQNKLLNYQYKLRTK